MFAALRDDRDESAANRDEPVLLIVLLAGFALSLASSAAKGYHGLDFAAWLFFAGSMTGIAAYWTFGAILYWAAKWFGGLGSYRRARHVLAFASVPLALSLVVSPAGRHVFLYAWYPFVAWAAVLLVVGVRAVHGWSWPRSAAVAAIPIAAAALLLLEL